jgi:hypothetical protein
LQPARRFVTGAKRTDCKSAAGCKPAPQYFKTTSTQIRRKILSLILFAIAFGYLEAAVVVYLRTLNSALARGQLFPLAPLTPLFKIEVGREAATIVMLAAVAAASGTRWLPAFALVFGTWDLVFYAALKFLIDWPASLFTWDILFLLPVPWIGPVLAPCIVAASLVTGGILGLSQPIHRSRVDAMLLTAGAAVIILSFTWDWRFIATGGLPRHFPWPIFWTGETLGIVAVLRALNSRPAL